MTQLILASQSLGRKKLLEQCRIPFQIIPSSLDEEKIIAENPLATIKLRAKMKGEDVFSKITTSPKLPRLLKSLNYLILSADSGAILGKELIGKPKDYEDAVRILKKLSGNRHEFVTGVYMIKMSNVKAPASTAKRGEQNFQFHDTSFVTFRKLSDEDIKRYLSIIDYTKLAGAYALYSGQDFITNVKGSLSNVIGLPMEKVLPVLIDTSFVLNTHCHPRPASPKLVRGEPDRGSI